MAFEELAIATATYIRTQPEWQCIFEYMDLVLCSEGAVPGGSFRVHLLSGEWFESVRARTPVKDLVRTQTSPCAPNLVLKSSGTTGSDKVMIKSSAAHDFGINLHVQHAGFTSRSRYLVNMPFSLLTVHQYAAACVRHGGTCISDSNIDVATALVKYRVTHVVFLPLMLPGLLESLSDDYQKPPELSVTTFGAPVPPTIRKRILCDVASDLIESYATNETGRVCTINDDGLGTVLPGVEVEIVDADHQPIHGVEGRVRIKSGGSVSGYLNDLDATRRMFTDGWFYPGDLGIMYGPRSVKLLGRADDIINVRGIKVAPYALEEKLIAELPIKDVCVSAAADSEGTNSICVAIVPETEIEMGEIANRAMQYVPQTLRPAHVQWVERIPRTTTGKIRRAQMKTILTQHLTKIGTPDF